MVRQKQNKHFYSKSRVNLLHSPFQLDLSSEQVRQPWTSLKPFWASVSSALLYNTSAFVLIVNIQFTCQLNCLIFLLHIFKLKLELEEMLPILSCSQAFHQHGPVYLLMSLTPPDVSNTIGTYMLYNPNFTALVNVIFSSSTSLAIWKCPFLPPLFLPLKDNLCPSSTKPFLTTTVQRSSSFKFMAFILCSIQSKYGYIYLAFYCYLNLTLFLLFLYASGLPTISKTS